MQNLWHEQAVAADRLTPENRIEWLAAGGVFERREGKRRWKAVFPPDKRS